MAYNYTNPFASNPFINNPNANVGPVYYPRTFTDFSQQNDLIFVLDENAARSYPIGNGQKIILWDKNYPKFYIKSVDMAGIPSFRKFSFTEDVVDQPNIETSKPVETVTDVYVTKTDMEKMFSDFRSSLINELKSRNHNGKPPFKKEE